MNSVKFHDHAALRSKDYRPKNSKMFFFVSYFYDQLFSRKIFVKQNWVVLKRTDWWNFELIPSFDRINPIYFFAFLAAGFLAAFLAGFAVFFAGAFLAADLAAFFAGAFLTVGFLAAGLASAFLNFHR